MIQIGAAFVDQADCKQKLRSGNSVEQWKLFERMCAEAFVEAREGSTHIGTRAYVLVLASACYTSMKSGEAYNHPQSGAITFRELR